MLVRTESRDSCNQIKENPSKTWHYIFELVTLDISNINDLSRVPSLKV
jgi:hypothetical protein